MSSTIFYKKLTLLLIQNYKIKNLRIFSYTVFIPTGCIKSKIKDIENSLNSINNTKANIVLSLGRVSYYFV